MQSLVSIIIPVYKVEQYLDRCVNSVVDQTYKNLEIILVDDGSPDSCGNLCDEWKTKDSRIKVIHKKNGGLSDARNAGLKIATGKYVLFIDSDDWISLVMVEKMVEAMEKNSVDMVICQYYLSYPDGQNICKSKKNDNQLLNVKETISLLLKDSIITNHAWRKLYKRNLVNQDCFPVGMNYEDIYAMPELIFACEKIYYLDAAYYYYFQNQNSITNTASYKNSMDHYNAKKHSYEVIKEKFPEMEKELNLAKEKTILHVCNNLIKIEGNYKLTGLKRKVFCELKTQTKGLHGFGLTKNRMLLFLSFKISIRLFLMLSWFKSITIKFIKK